jgi:hypothetical protein
VRTFLELHAVATPACASSAGTLPSTGSIQLSQGDYLLDLSTLGAGLQDANITFTVAPEVGGVLLTGITLTAGAGGLTAISPVFETCPGGAVMLDPNDSFGDLRFDLAPGQSLMVGTGTLSLAGASLGERFAIRFAALLPLAGPLAAPVDYQGACIP